MGSALSDIKKQTMHGGGAERLPRPLLIKANYTYKKLFPWTKKKRIYIGQNARSQV